jgi:hypothetical protein
LFSIVRANQCHISRLQTEMENNQLLVLENDLTIHFIQSSFYLLIFPFSWEGSAVEWALCFIRSDSMRR